VAMRWSEGPGSGVRSVLGGVVAGVCLLFQVHRSGMADPRPWREQQQEPDVRAGVHGVTLIGGEGDDETCAAGHALSSARGDSTSPSITVTHALLCTW
jgi:hypothetical protein